MPKMPFLFEFAENKMLQWWILISYYIWRIALGNRRHHIALQKKLSSGDKGGFFLAIGKQKWLHVGLHQCHLLAETSVGIEEIRQHAESFKLKVATNRKSLKESGNIYKGSTVKWQHWKMCTS